jgi:hypothetical protein
MIALPAYLTSADNLGDIWKERSDALKHMVADLIETGNFRDRGDAIKQLRADGYAVIEVLILVDEAIWECKQEIVARLMSDVNHLSPANASPVNGHPGYGGSAQPLNNNRTGLPADSAGHCPQT